MVQPKASIAGPTLQGLAFTHEEPSLKDMFLNLLTTSMDGRKSESAHPAFVEIIKQLTSDDAELLQYILKKPTNMPIVRIEQTFKGLSGQTAILHHLLDLNHSSTNQPIVNNKLPAIVDNWIRLGLVNVDYGQHLVKESAYLWVEKRPEYIAICEGMNNEGRSVTYTRGVIYPTEFGKQFSEAVALK